MCGLRSHYSALPGERLHSNPRSHIEKSGSAGFGEKKKKEKGRDGSSNGGNSAPARKSEPGVGVDPLATGELSTRTN